MGQWVPKWSGPNLISARYRAFENNLFIIINQTGPALEKKDFFTKISNQILLSPIKMEICKKKDFQSKKDFCNQKSFLNQFFFESNPGGPEAVQKVDSKKRFRPETTILIEILSGKCPSRDEKAFALISPRGV